MMIGLVPFNAVYSLFLMSILLLLNINISAGILGFLVFSVLGITVVLHGVGVLFLIKLTQLTPLWTWLYNLPVIPFTRFNNTVIFGGMMLGWLLSLPMYWGVQKFVVAYRHSLKEKVEQFKIVKAMKMSRFYGVVQKVLGLIT